ncbi:unnamed protein product [Acanthoscelides obtectus]|uniref:Uncharacterized protein n=1 Tax=Acanthoscelides obtectus TaxID=200917 RepID=A0A9P0KC52_ACAOB|nr:unnamed protein product [Acanthoscelides obtectus]CAK1633413.1 hypothetical protein AOBTE_LOCUS8113 [Acanthoscelides obtectus]
MNEPEPLQDDDQNREWEEENVNGNDVHRRCKVTLITGDEILEKWEVATNFPHYTPSERTSLPHTKDIHMKIEDKKVEAACYVIKAKSKHLNTIRMITNKIVKL